jgi:hypothetical protein
MDKDVTITVGTNITVNPDPVEVKKGLEQVKWNCQNTNVTSLTVALKDGSYNVPCTRKNDGTWECKSKKFETDGTYAYGVTAVVDGVTKYLDPEIIVRP